eukprot:9491435-Pyramimonas_sp.AAC.1
METTQMEPACPPPLRLQPVEGLRECRDRSILQRRRRPLSLQGHGPSHPLFVGPRSGACRVFVRSSFRLQSGR